MTTYQHRAYKVEAIQAPGFQGHECGGSIESLVAWLNEHAFDRGTTLPERRTWQYDCSSERGTIRIGDEEVPFRSAQWIVQRDSSFFTMSPSEFRKEFTPTENTK